MRKSNRIVRSVVVAVAVVTLGTAGASGSGRGVEVDASLVGTQLEVQTTERVIGGQYIGVVPIQFVLQALCMQCLHGITASQGIDYLAIAGCVVICYAAF